MAETIQSLDQLGAIKPAAPEGPKYSQKLDKQGRSYATGKRKNAVARVWIKPGSGKIEVNTKAVEIFFARPRSGACRSHKRGPAHPLSFRISALPARPA